MTDKYTNDWLMLAVHSIDPSGLGIRKYYPRTESKECSLPGCNEMTAHNGGYCCADHCKEHRRMIKEALKND